MAYTVHPNGDFLLRPGNYSIGHKVWDHIITMSRYFDTTVDNLASTEFYKIWTLPAGFTLLRAYFNVRTIEDETGTIDLVDDDSASNTIISNANMENLGVTGSAAPLDYSSSGFVVLRPDHALEDCKFFVTIEGIIYNTSM